jgi:hypothetical protein
MWDSLAPGGTRPSGYCQGDVVAAVAPRDGVYQRDSTGTERTTHS